MISIAIDGPAGAGKSTIARKTAEKLGFIYVDTGALYRTVGLGAMRTNTDINDPQQTKKLLSEIKVDLGFTDGEQRVYLNGEDVSEKIRTPEASMMASKVSAVPAVREFLLDLQKEMAVKYNVIMDGRDIGTVVLPNARVKIFLTASAEVRADRRVKQLEEKGIECDYDQVLTEIQQRDYQDSHRVIAPLKPADDSVTVDTSNLTLEESIKKLYDLISENIK